MTTLYQTRDNDSRREFHRTQINLHAEDVAWLQRRYGYGWTQQIRDLVHEFVRAKRYYGPDKCDAHDFSPDRKTYIEQQPDGTFKQRPR